MQTKVGRLAASVLMQQVDDNVSVFDPRTGTALVLNRTAADVLALADGESTLCEITDTLASAYGVQPEAISQDVRDVVERLTLAGVLATDVT